MPVIVSACVLVVLAGVKMNGAGVTQDLFVGCLESSCDSCHRRFGCPCAGADSISMVFADSQRVPSYSHSRPGLPAFLRNPMVQIGIVWEALPPLQRSL